MRRINTRFATMRRWITSIENTLHVIGEDDTDALDITVYPSNLSSTISKIDTGDGVDFIKASGTNVGNFNLSIIAWGTNTVAEVECIVRVSDDADIADDFDIAVTRGIDPI